MYGAVNRTVQRGQEETSMRAPGIGKSFVEKVELEKGEGEGH